MVLLLRWLFALCLLALAAAGGLWLADHPGTMQIDWMGYRITAEFWVVLAALGVLMLFVWALTGMWLKLWHGAAASGQKRIYKKQSQGLDALTHAVAALSCRDYVRAGQHLERSQRFLGKDAPLNVLLGAHLASKTGDKTAMVQALETMTTMPQTEFLAYHSLSSLAERDQEAAKTLQYAKEAYQLRPDLEETVCRYLGLLVKSEAFEEAQALIRQVRRHRTFSRKQQRHYLARVYYAEYAVRPDEASPKLLERAFALDPTFPASYQHIAELYQAGKQRQALQAIYKSWKYAPHAELTDILLHYFDDDQPEKALKRVTVLLQRHPNHMESHLAMARAGMAAKQWDIARNHLKAALAIAPQMRVFRLLAKLEEEGMQDEQAASNWLKRMQSAEPDPSWHCSQCGHHQAHWETHCSRCSSFDSFVWEAKSGHHDQGFDGEDILTINVAR